MNDREREESRKCCVGVCWRQIEVETNGAIQEKTLPKVANKHGVVIAPQEKGWMVTEGMKTWVQKVWHARRGGLGRQRSLLVYDTFKAHVTESVKAAFVRENINLAVIPGGLPRQFCSR